MKILVADPIDNAGIEVLKSQASVDVKTGLKPEEIKNIIGDYEALIVRSETRATDEIIQAGKKLAKKCGVPDDYFSDPCPEFLSILRPKPGGTYVIRKREE